MLPALRQEETCLLELVSYIHLNPIRAGIVPSLEALKDYRYCGHGCILGRNRQLDLHRKYFYGLVTLYVRVEMHMKALSVIAWQGGIGLI